MKFKRWAAPILAVAMAAMAGLGLAADEPRAKPAFGEPSLSPDGSEIAFVSGGDIWTVPAQGGVARLLVTDPATESRPLYSPDGKKLAFQSTRDGPPSLFVLTLATGEVQRLTWDDGGDELDAWSADSQWLYFSSTVADVGRQTDIFRVRSTGGAPLEVSRERYLAEFHAAPSPDGSQIALMARGLSNTQWWRNGHSHGDNTEIWLKPVADAGPYRKLLADDAKHAWPMWSSTGGELYFMSDLNGVENLWRMSLAANAKPEAVTKFTTGRVLWPSMGGGGSSIVFERNFGIWRYDVRSGQAVQVNITLRGAPAAAGERHLNETTISAKALSGDGKKLANVAHGKLFAASAKDGGPGQRVGDDTGAASEPVWSPDSTHLIYVSEQGLEAHVRDYDLVKQTGSALTTGPGFDQGLSYSPDGKRIAYVHADKELHVLTLATDKTPAKDVMVYRGAVGSSNTSPPAWSPDSRWVAFLVTDSRSFVNLDVIDADGGEARPISFLAEGETDGPIAWSPDGKYLLFSTGQRSEDAKIVRIDLLPHVPKYREDAFRDLFKPADQPDRPQTTPGPVPPAPAAPATSPAPAPAPAAAAPTDTAKGDLTKADPPDPKAAPKKKIEPTKIVFDGIRERATILPLAFNVRNPVISPDGKTLVFQARVGGQTNLYSYNLDELARDLPTPQAVTTTRRAKSIPAFTPDSKEIFYLEAGGVVASPVETPRARPVAINAELDVDFDTEKMQVFDETWTTLNRRFFDPKFNGRDWKAIYTEWKPYMAGVRTPDEMRRTLNLMIGELNASHSGVGRPGSGFGAAPAPRTGDLGLRFEREPYEAGKGLVIREVIALGPAAIEGTIKPGETLLSVNGTPLTAKTNLDQLLQNQSGKRVVLRIGAAGDPAKAREAIVRPVTTASVIGLAYRQWVNERRAYVEKASQGRLGYVHIADMSDASLAQLYLDLDAQNQGRDGVVIDIRNNNGGYVNGRVLDVITRKNYLQMTPRDLFVMPARQALGQRALGTPTVLVTNESSLSDAEDFTEGYRATGAGKVVGQPTSGWIIFTGSEGLIDGSSVRTPTVRIQDLSGGDMEMHPRPVDVTVERPLGETLAGRDAQLDAAVATLLKGLPAKR